VSRFFRKAPVVAKSELGEFDPLRILSSLLVAPIPRHAFPRLRTMAYRIGGLRIGRSTLILGGLDLAGPRGSARKLKIGARCYFTTPLYLDLNAEIIIGDQVTIGRHVQLVTAGHEIGPSHYRCGRSQPEPIHIGDGAWIGAGAIILPGVKLGAGCVVAAGAVVSNDVAPNTLVGGVPARPIRNLATE
jgi:maltose O-acetyltransferase